MLRSNLKAIFFIDFVKLVRHPGSQFFGKSHRVEMIENRLLIAVHFFGQFTTCLAAVLLQKRLETFFVEFRRSSATRRVFEAKVAIFELCKPFPCCRLAYNTFSVHVADVPSGFGSFLTSMKSEEEQVSKMLIFTSWIFHF
jgi:hypothetical protein